jgi:hypothetical protein
MTVIDDGYEGAANSASMSELGTMDCLDFPPGFPEDLVRFLPLRIGVSFTLTEWTCVSREMYEQHKVGCLQDSLIHLTRGYEIFLSYSFYSETVTPAWAYNIDWPLRRRGKTDGAITDRSRYGWDIERSNMFFELRNKPIRPYSSRLMLKTGGRTVAEAVERWERLALAIRRQFNNRI